MASVEVLKTIVAAGADLTLLQPRQGATIRELCELAVKSGSKITVSADQKPELIKELLERHRGVAFVDAGKQRDR